MFPAYHAVRPAQHKNGASRPTWSAWAARQRQERRHWWCGRGRWKRRCRRAWRRRGSWWSWRPVWATGASWPTGRTGEIGLPAVRPNQASRRTQRPFVRMSSLPKSIIGCAKQLMFAAGPKAVLRLHDRQRPVAPESGYPGRQTERSEMGPGPGPRGTSRQSLVARSLHRSSGRTMSTWS